MIQARTNHRKIRLTIPFYGGVLMGVLAMSFSGTSRGRVSAASDVQIKDAQQPETEDLRWQKVDAGAFSILAPLGWKLHQLKGVDSYVGEFTGEGIVLKFDFGGYSNPFKEEEKPAYLVVHKSIGGLPAKIVHPKTPGHGLTGIYFPRTFSSNKLSVFGQDLTSRQQEQVLKIFETIRFGSPVPRVVPPPEKSVQ